MTYDPRMWLSVSQMKSITKCGRAFELERIEKKPSRPAYWTVRGIAVHDTIENWERGGRDNFPIDFYRDIAWPQALEKTLERYPDQKKWQKTPRVGSVKRDGELRFDDGIRQVERYVERALDEQDEWTVEHFEVPFSLEPGGEDFIVRGYIDQIILWRDGDRTLRDLKTGGDDSESNTQLGIYSLGAKVKLGLDLDWGDFWYTKLDRASEPIDLRPYTMEYMIQEFRKLYQIKKQGLYLANPSIKNCFACGVKEFCLEAK